MARDPIDPEMRRRFEAAEKVRIGDTALRRPALAPTETALRAHFESDVAREASPLENPHVEPRVGSAERAQARPAAVLLAVVLREAAPTVIVTQRHPDLSDPGQWVFPGGRADEQDAGPVATALREAHEEIGLDPARVEVLGRLGDYVSHSGFRISPTLALVKPPVELTPEPGEVSAIAEIELARILDSSSYFLYRYAGRRDRAHFALESGAEGVMLTGVTASICIGLYGELLKTAGGAIR